MRSIISPLSFLLIAATPANEVASWRAQADKVSIIRDDFGIAHASAPTDADAIFGMIYAQAEDDFPRIEANCLTALGRTAEDEGEGAIWQIFAPASMSARASSRRIMAIAPAG